MASRKAKPGSERDVQRRAIIFLRKRKWFVINTSGAWRSARGMAGVTDLICHLQGVTIYIECKGFGVENLRPAQKKFRKRITPYLGLTLIWMLVNDKNYSKFEDQIRRIENDNCF